VLWLHNYLGPATEHARIPVGQGVCGTAVLEKKNQNVADVTQLDNYLACSPQTRSELVVLIRAGDEILGQIDIDSNRTAAFTGEDEEGVQAVADKLAEVLMAERRWGDGRVAGGGGGGASPLRFRPGEGGGTAGGGRRWARVPGPVMGDAAAAALREILAPNAGPLTLDGTRTYVVGRRRVVVIDPGPAALAHLDAV